MNIGQKIRVEERMILGARRIVNILRKHGIATMRMLEQKISDAGPTPQRIDPHILTKSRIELVNHGYLQVRAAGNTQWYSLSKTDPEIVERRFQELSGIQRQTERRNFTDRMGDTAEIAVMKGMQANKLPFVGHFTDLDKHGDELRYVKHDPDFFSGKPIIGGKLDFILFNPNAGALGIEIKNIREWIYPEKQLVKDLLSKCLDIDVVPVLIARRIHYTTFSILNACGAIVHQFYNQRYPNSEAELAALVSHKDRLGYFDVRVGNEPDDRMIKFFGNSIPLAAPRMREVFDEKKDLISDYVENRITYVEFERRLRGEWNDEEE